MYGILLFVAASSSVSPAIPKDFLDWYRPNDMPGYHIAKGISRSVGIRVTVRPDGTLQSCEVEDSGGDAKLAQLTCALTMKRAKFEPARGIDGSPGYGIFRTHVAWAIEYPFSPPKTEDLAVTVSSLPKGERSPAYVRTIFAVDAFGKLSSCSAEPPLARGMKSNPVLVQIACNELIKSYVAQPAKDDAGNVVQSIQNALVSFTRD